MTDPIIPVVLAGGAGTRLWPLSREEYPKQFLRLLGEDSLLQATLRRVRDVTHHHPMIVSHRDHRFIVAQDVLEKRLGPAQIVLEPTARNTAVAIGAAAHLALQRNPNALMLVLPSDHVIQDLAGFKAAVLVAAKAASLGQLMTFGIQPQFAATGFGYIARGDALPQAEGCFRIRQFVEKPEAARAASFVQSGEWLWNSGMFLLRADCYLHELRNAAPEIAKAAEAAVAGAKANDDFIHLDEAPYAACPKISIDHAVMEHTLHAGVVPCDIGWNDIGSWSALWDIGEKDAAQNVIVGDAITHATENCYIRTEGPLVATYGLHDTVVVATSDVVMVSSRQQPQGIQNILEQLRSQKRPELVTPRLQHRPWGHHEVIVEGLDFKVKKITVNPGARLSLQRHQHRSEHWVVVHGVAEVEIVESKLQMKKELRPNTSAYIPRGAIHRLANPGTEVLEVIEVQCGEYLGEDDIERFSDDYGR